MINVIIFLQVRLKSKRLPQKALKLVNNRPLIDFLLERLSLTKQKIILAIPYGESLYFKGIILKYKNVEIFEGNETNVLKRCYNMSLKYPSKHYVRVTGDNPFTSIKCLMSLFKKHLIENCDLSYYKGLPYGSGTEIFTKKTLNKVYQEAVTQEQKEHLTQYIYQNPHLFKIKGFEVSKEYFAPRLRVTIDTQEDFENFKKRVLRNLPLRIIPLKKIINQEKIN